MMTILPLNASEHVVRIPFPVPACLTLRTAGNMRRDGAARRQVYERLSLDPEGVHVAEQIHSREISEVGSSVIEERTVCGESLHRSVDGLLTEDNSCVLAVTVADCMPIFIFDQGSGLRALLHSGWRGTGILDNALRLFMARGSEPADIVVCLGPCISVDSYKVDEARATEFAEEWGASAVSVRSGEHFLDLRTANQEICDRHGIAAVNTIDHCTFRTPVFGSFRREGPENFTLMLALLGSKETQINA